MTNIDKINNEIDNIIITCEKYSNDFNEELNVIKKSINYNDIPLSISVYFDDVQKGSDLLNDLKLKQYEFGKNYQTDKFIKELREIGNIGNENANKFQRLYFRDEEFRNYIRNNNIDKNAIFDYLYKIIIDYYQKIGYLVEFLYYLGY